MKAFVAISAACLLVMPALSCAQDQTTARNGRLAARQNVAQNQDPDHTPATPDTRRLETVSWNAVTHELTWVIARGEKQGTEFRPISKDTYLIKLDEATMTFNGETRGFSKQEAANVHVLMDLVAKYAADSTIWWDQGQGERLDGNGKPQRKKKEVSGAGVTHIAFNQPAPAEAGSLADLQERIRRMEKQLAALKQIERLLLATSPTQSERF
ncbi:MAG TPA: hypothetical protein PLA43_02170 [Bryobacteraceae bacterium]|nr:hypothetical protein [Bryobacteraceae bacterium]HPU70734.1 hypothetical protein [Bryobacteraceae bacterium]